MEWNTLSVVHNNSREYLVGVECDYCESWIACVLMLMLMLITYPVDNGAYAELYASKGDV